MLRVKNSLTSSRSLFFSSINLQSSRSQAPPTDKDFKKDDGEEEFRPCFIIPKRKLNAQLVLERMMGKREDKLIINKNFRNQLASRPPRTEDMDVNQDWQSVWPGAQSFKANSVPLPIRMGTRPDPSKRPPFKKVGNLELVKIPNFLHLTPKAIENHCAAIKKFCTPYPKELKGNKSLTSEVLPLVTEYSDYVHQGPSLRDPRARKVTLKVSLKSLNLSDHGREKLIRLVGNRYDEKTDVITLENDRCYTRKQNNDYGVYLLTVLLNEAEKVEA